MKRNRWSLVAAIGGLLVAGLVACHDRASPVSKSVVVGGDNQPVVAKTQSTTDAAVRLPTVVITAPME